MKAKTIRHPFILATCFVLGLIPYGLFAQEISSWVSPKTPPQAIQTASPELLVDINLEFLMQGPKTHYGADLFQKKPGFANYTPPEEKFTLQGIARSPAGSTAIIDGKVFKSGDRLGSRKISEIGPNFVVLEKGDSQLELVLPPIAPRESLLGEKK